MIFLVWSGKMKNPKKLFVVYLQLYMMVQPPADRFTGGCGGVAAIHYVKHSALDPDKPG